MDTQLGGRVVVVTGGSSGIGKAIAIAFGREGAKVGLTYASRKTAADQVAKEIELGGGASLTARLDLGDPSSIHSAMQEVVSRWGGIDVLVANAVQWPHEAAGRLIDSSPDSWENAVRTNLVGTATTVRAAWPALAESPSGRVVLVSTGVTRSGMPGATAYATAKAGLEGLMAALKWEGGDDGILVNVVAPGFTITEGNLERFPDEVRESVRQRTPSGHLSVPEDVAAAAVFLGSAINGNISGVYLPVAGGTD